MNHRMRTIRTICLLAVVLMVSGFVGYARVTNHADAYGGADIIGNPHGATDALFIGDANNIKRVYFFNGVTKPTGGTTTPVTSEKCGFGPFTVFRADAYLTGTMTGTAPTVAIKWKHSVDQGAHWTDVGTWAPINATLTPPSQTNLVYDHGDVVIPLTTPVITPAAMYGDCWEAELTFGGTGAVGANLEVVMTAK